MKKKVIKRRRITTVSKSKIIGQYKTTEGVSFKEWENIPLDVPPTKDSR